MFRIGIAATAMAQGGPYVKYQDCVQGTRISRADGSRYGVDVHVVS